VPLSLTADQVSLRTRRLDRRLRFRRLRTLFLLGPLLLLALRMPNSVASSCRLNTAIANTSPTKMSSKTNGSEISVKVAWFTIRIAPVGIVTYSELSKRYCPARNLGSICELAEYTPLLV
jgi:hypothetical protein